MPRSRRAVDRWRAPVEPADEPWVAAVVAARPAMARVYREAVAGGLAPIDHQGHGYFLLLDQTEPARLQRYTLGDDGGLYWAPIAERYTDVAREAHSWLLWYPREWLALGPDGELLAVGGGRRVPFAERVRLDLDAVRAARARAHPAVGGTSAGRGAEQQRGQHGDEQ